MEYACCFCGAEVGTMERLFAPVWRDPHRVSVIAHLTCVEVFEGLPAWPRERRQRRGKA